MIALHKKTLLAIHLAMAIIFALSFGEARAVNERFNPRMMDEANKIISSYEAQIVKDGPSVEAYEWIIRGLKMRDGAYFSNDAASELEGRIFESYKKILELSPSHYDANAEVIAREMERSNFDGLIERADKLIAANPSRFEAKLIRGRLLFYSADFDNAIMEFTHAIALIPSDRVSELDYYKKILETANKFSVAMKKLSPDGKSDPAEAPAMLELASIYLDKAMLKKPSNLDRGIELLKKSIEKDPNYAESYIKLGETLGEIKKDYKEAMNILRKADNIAKEKPVLKRIRLLSQKYYKLNLSKGKGKNKK